MNISLIFKTKAQIRNICFCLRLFGDFAFSYRMTDDTVFSNWQSKRDYRDNQVTLDRKKREIQRYSSA